jgi:hypothetical protein
MEIYGELPTGPVVFAACDSLYFEEHAPSFVYSANCVNKDVHIHICNPTERALALASILNATTQVKCTFTFNDIDIANPTEETRSYYACLRFFVLPAILPHAKKVLTLDIDCLIMKPFEFPEQMIGYFPREPLPGTIGWEAQGTRVAAGAVYTSMGAFDHVVEVVRQIKQSPMRWFVDQIALSTVFTKLPKEKVFHYDSSFMDWEFVQGSVIWTGKGPRKYENQTYISKKIEFNYVNRMIKDYKTVILKPRLDIPFKKMGLCKATGAPIIPIREHWVNFVNKLASEKPNSLIIEMPRWMFNNRIQTYFNDDVQFYVPHVEKHNFKGNDNTHYYMQTVFPWLFTVDKEGWGGGASFVNKFDPEAEYSTKAFDALSEYIKNGNSKFDQPKNQLVVNKPFILVPLQLPHDETIIWHSDVKCPEFVERICEWADSDKDAPLVVFKGHPVNLQSMEPLKAIIAKYKNVMYVDVVNIIDAIRKSLGVFVINSGTGQEAMLLDRPVVCFGKCEYQSAVINGDIKNLSKTYNHMINLNKEYMYRLYRKWYHWYLSSITLDSRPNKLVSTP